MFRDSRAAITQQHEGHGNPSNASQTILGQTVPSISLLRSFTPSKDLAHSHNCHLSNLWAHFVVQSYFHDPIPEALI
jgi:hypothetical protein